MNGAVVTIITASLSAGLFEFIKFLIQRKDNKQTTNDDLSKQLSEIKTDIEKIKKDQKRNETDNVRLQLMMMYQDYPDKVEKIMEIAHHYFIDLEGNWYATELFDDFCEEHKLEKPLWFKNKNKVD